MDKMVQGQFGQLNYPKDRTFGIRGVFYINLLSSNFVSFLKSVFTCQCCRKKQPLPDEDDDWLVENSENI